jgi:hypothetical protein
MRHKRTSSGGTIGLLQGTLDMMIPNAGEGPQHGRRTARYTRSEEFLHIERGSLYPHCIGEEQGWIDAE